MTFTCGVCGTMVTGIAGHVDLLEVMKVHGQVAFGKTESELGEVWRTIPRDIDVLITHGPAYDYGDLTASKFGSKRIGSSSLTNQLVYEQWPNLKLHVFGHNHGGFGEYDLKGIRMMNVSYLNDDYAPANDLVVVDL